jgi:TonB family protein
MHEVVVGALVALALSLVAMSMGGAQEAGAQQDLMSSQPSDSASGWIHMTPPELISSPALRFPDLAEVADMAGRVTLKVWVGKDGMPIKTYVYGRDPEVAFVFDEEARRFGMGCRFTPARDSAGNPVVIGMCMPLRFEPKGFTAAACEHVPAPEYPEWARELGLDGWVGLMVLVDEGGRVISDQTHIMTRYPPETTVFDEAAKRAAAQAVFQPGIKYGVPTKSWAFLKVEFNMPVH